MPKVSIVIPCYNHGEYIDEAVDSILSQTFKDFEIIIVNDGSTDEFTIQKLKAYDKVKTRVIHIENQGLPFARNTGISQAVGEYIVALDADDTFEPTFLEKAVQVVEQQPDVGIVACGINYFGYVNRKVMPLSGDVRVCLSQSGTVGSSFFRKVCWEQAGGYHAHVWGYEDWDFNISVTKHGWRLHVIEEYLFNYRQHRASMRLEAHKNRPELVRKLVQEHREVYEQYLEEVIFEKEQKIFMIAQKKRAYRESLDYKLGHALLTPLRAIMRLFK